MALFQRGSFLIWAWIRLQIGNDSNGWMFAKKKGLETAADIAPFFQFFSAL